MTNLEKDLLLSIKKNLKDSAKTSWTSGNLEKFRDWAANMYHVINTSCSTLDAILKQPTEDGKE